MKRTCSFLSGLLFLVFTSLLVFGISTVLFNSDQPEPLQKQNAPQPVDLLSVRDSLTKGGGDSLAIGGYVPRVAEMLEANEAVAQVKTQNFGVSGNTSNL